MKFPPFAVASLQLKFLKENFGVLVNGTVQRKNCPAEAHFGTAKKYKPSVAKPKGILKVAKRVGEDIYFYAWMDSAAVYFMDTGFGGLCSLRTIYRRGKDGLVSSFLVPVMIIMYNMYMHGGLVTTQLTNPGWSEH